MVKGASQMINFQTIVSRDVVSPAAPSMDIPRNWRSELGTFWRDIEEAGSVAKAIRLRSSSAVVQRECVPLQGGDEISIKASCWAHFRTVCFGIL